jgi:hypothetical protein
MGRFRGGIPFIFLPDKVLLAEVDEVDDRLGGQERQTVHDINLVRI